MSKELKFKFESNQEHQVAAVDSVVNLFNGFSQEIAEFQLVFDVIPNVPDFFNFEEDWLLGNYSEVVNQNNGYKEATGSLPDLPLNSSLAYDEGFALSIPGLGDRSVCFPVFTIEMETGTGKTYTYFKTIHELRRKYSFRKFIIVVPSIAIYEGTITAFKQTKEHFKTLYDNEPIHLIEYDGQAIGRVSDFAKSSFTEIMIMTIDSFNKATNIIHKRTEKVQGEWLPIQYIQATRPILILDESQNYESELSRQALRTLNPLFAINYSATPAKKKLTGTNSLTDKYNLIYRLSPVDAFRLNLVKKIEVLGVTQQHNLNDPNLSLSLDSISNNKGLPTAIVHAYILNSGLKSQQPIKLKANDDLSNKTHNPDFKGFVVEEINASTNQIIFTNQSILTTIGKDSITLSKREIFRVQIEETIKIHFTRQRALLKKGIKVLSLFFIDKVANYKGDDPLIKNLFEEAFNRFKLDDEYFKKFEASEVHSGYFAKKKDSNTFLDSFELTGVNQTEKKKIQEAEKEAFRLIMQDKERLLNFSEKTSFIFAHSALREGWDNPNVFCICTLNATISENRKRQEIGRGLRLARSSGGEQIKDDSVNILTVVANESYEQYVDSLQKEYIESGDIAPTKPTKAATADAYRIDNIFNSVDFHKFWRSLSQQTDYTININTAELIKQCSDHFNSKSVFFPDPQIVITRGDFVISEYTIRLLGFKPGQVRLQLSITNTNDRNDLYENWFPIGYDFGRRIKDPSLFGFKIVKINPNNAEPSILFGNNKTLYLDQPFTFTGNPETSVVNRSVKQAKDTFPVFNLLERTSKALGLTRPTINAIFKSIEQERKVKIFSNPEGFSGVFIKEIKEQLANHVAKKIEYRLTKDLVQYKIEEIFPPFKKYVQRELISGSNHSLYDKIQTDSDIERNFVQNCLQPDDKNGNVVCYFKFPSNFKIRIPKIITNYNPDWGIIRSIDGTSKIELVRETKGNINPNLLQFPNEKRKIDCAKKHFHAIGINYRQVTDEIISYWEDDPEDKTATIFDEVN